MNTPKSLDSDKNFKLEHTLFCCELRFATIYALFGDLWGKNAFLGQKQFFLGQEVHYYMIYIAYSIELNLQICNYAQKRRICRKHCKYALDKNFHDHFCPQRCSATLSLQIDEHSQFVQITFSKSKTHFPF